MSFSPAEYVRETMQWDSFGDTGRDQDGKLRASETGGSQCPIVGPRHRPCGHPNLLTRAGCRRRLLSNGFLLLWHTRIHFTARENDQPETRPFRDLSLGTAKLLSQMSVALAQLCQRCQMQHDRERNRVDRNHYQRKGTDQEIGCMQRKDLEP